MNTEEHRHDEERPLEKYYTRPLGERIYIEKTFKGTQEEYVEALRNSQTLYVSGIDEGVREERLWHIFGLAGPVRRVIMGVNRNTLTPCGFCFVEYSEARHADDATVFFRDLVVDGRTMRIEKDVGFSEGRQYGRGMYGGLNSADNCRKWRAG